ncbi:MAG: nucleotide pyrophosphohydrolase [Mycoplasmataceae bacterium]|nr:nucleotide pyrophosphohydrolase [Mycoplasmataceae bacterium]
MELKELIEKIVEFRDERNWKSFHTPENLAKSIMIEGAELLENYQWTNTGSKWDNKTNVNEELADVLIYALLMCHELKLDPSKIIREKISMNAKKYKDGQEKIVNED